MKRNVIHKRRENEKKTEVFCSGTNQFIIYNKREKAEKLYVLYT